MGKPYKNQDIRFIFKNDRQNHQLTIFGIGNYPGRNKNFKNANGEQGKIQLALQVIPSDKTMIHWVNNIRLIN